LIDELEPVESVDEDARQRLELFPWPLAMALLLSLLIAWLRYARPRRLAYG